MDTTQTRLLWAIQKGSDDRAWTDFYGIYCPMIRGFLRRRGLPDADVEDTAQEIMLIAQQALESGTYQPDKGRFRAWLFGVARRQALKAHRNRCRPTRIQAPANPEGGDPLAQLEDPHGLNDREIWDQEWRYALLNQALQHVRQQISYKEYQAFILYGVQQLPVQQVADELTITPSSVYVYKSRVLEAVRVWISEYEDD